jgi:hypothetical protein
VCAGRRGRVAQNLGFAVVIAVDPQQVHELSSGIDSGNLRPDSLIALGSVLAAHGGSLLADKGISAKSAASMKIFMSAHGFATKPGQRPIARATAMQT